MAVRNLANIMDLEGVVLTGPSLAVAGATYLPAIRDELERVYFARSVHVPQVWLSRSAATASAIGGAAMVLQSELVPLHDGLRLPDLKAVEPPLASPA